MVNDEIIEQCETLNLETLITAGTDTIIPVVITYMGKQFSANIRPINAVENNKIMQKYINKKESVALNTVKLALLKEDESRYSIEELEMIPSGVVDKLYNKICEISGIETNTNNIQEEKILRDLMGF